MRSDEFRHEINYQHGSFSMSFFIYCFFCRFAVLKARLDICFIITKYTQFSQLSKIKITMQTPVLENPSGGPIYIEVRITTIGSLDWQLQQQTSLGKTSQLKLQSILCFHNGVESVIKVIFAFCQNICFRAFCK